MPLLRLSINNVRRNITRSLAAVMGMAVAAAMMTGVTAMSTGYPVGAYGPYRSYLEGDILVYTAHCSVGYGTSIAGDSAWEMSAIGALEHTDFPHFHPRVRGEGYVRPVGRAPSPLTDQAIRALIGTDGVSAVYPLQMLPCLVQYSYGGEARYRTTYLRAREISAMDRYETSQYVVSGRGFQSSDDGKNVAMLLRPMSLRLPVVGGAISVLVPGAPKSVDDPTSFNWSHLSSFGLAVIGEIAVPTETEVVAVPGNGDTPARRELRQKYWESDHILVPRQTLIAIYHATGGSGMPPAYQASVVVDKMFDSKTVASRLAQKTPDYTVVTIPEQVERGRWESGQPNVPFDLSGAISLFGYLAAGFLVMANMYVLTSQRKHELGVLRAIGASGGEIFCLVMFEMVGYSVLGAVLGFGVVRGFYTFIMMFTDVGLIRGSLLTLQAFGRAILSTAAVAVLFGLGPAFYASRASTAEVLRGES